MIYKTYSGPRGEVNREPSLAIPDMSMSLTEIIRRHSIGTLPAQLVRDVLYDECDDFDSVLAEYAPAYDLVDKEKELAKLRQKFSAMREARAAAQRSGSADELSKPSASEVEDERSGAAGVSEANTGKAAEK